jgi:hypothetical protein
LALVTPSRWFLGGGGMLTGARRPGQIAVLQGGVWTVRAEQQGDIPAAA